MDPPKAFSVGFGVSELSRGESDLVVSRVEDVVESLEERHAVDEVESFATVGAQVADDEVHELVSAPDRGVELSKELSRCRSDDTSSCQDVYLQREAKLVRLERTQECSDTWM